MSCTRQILAALCGIGVLAASADPVRAASTQSPPSASAKHAAPAHAPADWAFLDQYCSECHNAEDWAGGVAFDTMTQEQIPENAETMEKVVRKLRGRLMPPPGNPLPDNTSVRSFISWMENNLDEASKAHAEPGRVGLHRLNRKEYANAVRDLLDLRIDSVALLPKDDAEDGFDNVASALQVSPSFIGQYLSAARTVAVQAVGNRAARPAGASYTARGTGTQQFYREGLPLGTRGGMVVDHFFPADGEYLINIGNMAQALWVYNMEFEHTVVVTVDGAEVYRTRIGGEEDMKAIDQQQDPAVDAINTRLKNIRFNAKAGHRKVGIAFIHRSFAESEDRLHMHVPGGGQDRVLRVSSFEIRGPFNATGLSETPSRKRIFVCYPANANEELPCAEKIITALAQRAYRRPLTQADKQPLLDFYRSGREAADFEGGIRKALTVILASPDFLYRAALPAEQLEAGTPYVISDTDLASRLSFFLWSSVPDEELLALATAGKLRGPEILAAQVRRMLVDKRAETLAGNFAFQWLNLAKLDEIEPDPAVFPYASRDGDLREDFRTELRLFIDSIFREDRNVLDLLTADHTFVNERLALHYDIHNVKGDRFRRVTLKESYRHGLLGKAGVLMLTSYPNRTAPVLRGAWVLENIMGTPPAPPPPNVESLQENKPGGQFKTIRELMAAHSVKPNCFACHGVMDPLGFALESFDATGRYRSWDRYARAEIDSSGKLPDGTQLKGPDDLRKALVSRPDQFVQTLTEKLLTYALGRTVEYHDMPAIRAIVRRAEQDNYRFSSIVLNIVQSDAFQKSKAPPAPDVQVTRQAALKGR